MRAAQYVRMSTEFQQYSIENQQAAIAEYAASHGFEIVRTYADPARSGLTLRRRPGLRELLEDVLTGQPGYDVILVYDVSRWGRFQDVDESAYYEFLCKKSGVRVLYCAEPFADDDHPTVAALVKSLKRAMAAEYLRELSHKVFVGQCHIAHLGYKLGGAPGFGLRRLLVSSEGLSKGILKHGERKSLDSDRVLFVPGPIEEVQVVREIFESFVNERLTAQQIADRLNVRQVSRDPYGRWTKSVVLDLLKHPKYVGSTVYNRISKKLGARETPNPPDQWITKPNLFPSIVSQELFAAAQLRFVRPKFLSDDELLDGLRRLLLEHGKLSAVIIKSAAGMRSYETLPSYQYYAKRFGSLGNAYKQIGYACNDDFVVGGKRSQRLASVRRSIRDELVKEIKQLGYEVTPAGEYIQIQGVALLRIEIATAHRQRRSGKRWKIRVFDQPLTKRLLVARVGQDSDTVIDYLLLTLPPNQKTLAIDDGLAQCTRLGLTLKDVADALLRSERDKQSMLFDPVPNREPDN